MVIDDNISIGVISNITNWTKISMFENSQFVNVKYSIIQ